ncbi:hypothetical protein JRQ81_012349 [Phrynocephalus forsythii]|uniref:Serpin domain-containing protein n=1 Tax=Phrynocephalus forsythii TaxID=171643 RepID=A0A9Q0Y0Y9_9SAUR|nr:hypothetical protein JRQ81_012349 [Phrynocephalus forsythii]
MNSLVTANSEFCVDLFKELLKSSSDENIFFSSLSVSAALGMVSLGARGETVTQMEKVAGAQCDRPGGPHEQFKSLLSSINQHTKNYSLSIANRLYGSNTYRFHQHYLDCTKKLYNAGLERVDFKHSTEEARKKINSWVESQTNGKIQNILEDIDPEAALILVNAIYFKGKWQQQFDKRNTHEAPFWTLKHHSKNVPMMFLKGKFNLAKINNPSMQVLELPYDSCDLSMFILLPENKEYPHQLGVGLTWAKLHEWTSSTHTKHQKMEVLIPKFKMEEKYSLKPILEALGMTDVFEEGKADLSGMSESDAQNLVVSRVIHKSYVEVSEEETKTWKLCFASASLAWG